MRQLSASLKQFLTAQRAYSCCWINSPLRSQQKKFGSSKAMSYIKTSLYIYSYLIKNKLSMIWIREYTKLKLHFKNLVLSSKLDIYLLHDNTLYIDYSQYHV